MISETKLDTSFPKRQFQMHGHSESHTFDRNWNGGGILVFFREGIKTKLIDSQKKIKGSSLN